MNIEFDDLIPVEEADFGFSDYKAKTYLVAFRIEIKDKYKELFKKLSMVDESYLNKLIALININNAKVINNHHIKKKNRKLLKDFIQKLENKYTENEFLGDYKSDSDRRLIYGTLDMLIASLNWLIDIKHIHYNKEEDKVFLEFNVNETVFKTNDNKFDLKSLGEFIGTLGVPETIKAYIISTWNELHQLNGSLDTSSNSFNTIGNLVYHLKSKENIIETPMDDYIDMVSIPLIDLDIQYDLNLSITLSGEMASEFNKMYNFLEIIKKENYITDVRLINILMDMLSYDYDYITTFLGRERYIMDDIINPSGIGIKAIEDRLDKDVYEKIFHEEENAKLMECCLSDDLSFIISHNATDIMYDVQKRDDEMHWNARIKIVNQIYDDIVSSIERIKKAGNTKSILFTLQ